MRSVNSCTYKSTAFLNGYDDAISGRLYDDEKEFCKEAYAKGFTKGQKFSNFPSGNCWWMSRNTWELLVNEELSN